MSNVTDSILLSIKKLNNVEPEYTAFDDDFIMYINSALATLTQLGIGPAEGFVVRDKTDYWEDFIGSDSRFEAVKTYVGRSVRLMFDPPNTSFAINMIQEQIKESLWRLGVLQDQVDEEAG